MPVPTESRGRRFSLQPSQQPNVRRKDDSGRRMSVEVLSQSRQTKGISEDPVLFVIAGTNGTKLVETPLLAMGWKRSEDKSCENFKLKWTDLKGQIDYNNFKEGEQLVNHIPNCDLITNKLGLLLSLRDYERVTWSVKNHPPALLMSEFVPETYMLDDRRDREAFLEAYNDGDIWICKPTGWNQGKGIYLIRDLGEFKDELSSRDEQLNDKSQKNPVGRIVQKYLTNPLLVNERKFDIRAYMVISSTAPFLVLYRRGYVRVCMHKYSNSSTNMTVHLTNQFIQKKDPGYNDVKNDTIWSMEYLYKYIYETYGEELGLTEDVGKLLDLKMQIIMRHVFNAVRHRLTTRIGYFEIYGFDFMIDTNMNVWLIEININPALNINCDHLREVIPPIIEETLQVSIECFEKSRKKKPLLPLSSLKTFTVIYDASGKSSLPENIRINVNPRKELTENDTQEETEDQDTSDLTGQEQEPPEAVTNEEETKSPVNDEPKPQNPTTKAVSPTAHARVSRVTEMKGGAGNSVEVSQNVCTFL